MLNVRMPEVDSSSEEVTEAYSVKYIRVHLECERPTGSLLKAMLNIPGQGPDVLGVMFWTKGHALFVFICGTFTHIQ